MIAAGTGDTLKIRRATVADLPKLVWISKRYTEELGFVPINHLREALKRDELLIADPSGAFCIYHARKDGWNVIYSVVVPISARGRGVGRALLGAIPLPQRLKCPDGLPSNGFYMALGFKLVAREWSKVRVLNVWEKEKPIDAGTTE